MLNRILFLLLFPVLLFSSEVPKNDKKYNKPYYSKNDFTLDIHGDGAFSAYYVDQNKYYKHGSGEKFTDRLIKDGEPLKSNQSPSTATGIGMPYDSNLLGDYRNSIDFSNSANLIINAKKKLDDNITYGLNMEIGLDTSAAKSLTTENAHIFIETTYGKLEMGNNEGAAENLKLDATSISTVGGGLNNGWHSYANLEGYYKEAVYSSGNSTRDFPTQHPFHVVPALYTEYTRAGPGYKRLKNDVAGIYAPKITYYSPRYSGAQFGISYTADETSIWNGDKSDKRDYKNVISSGINYEGTLENIKFKLSATGETGKYQNNNNDSTDDYFDLMGWNIGYNITYAGFKFAGSYGNLMQSGISEYYITNDLKQPEDLKLKSNPGDTTYWTLGGAYEIGPAMVSLAYFNSETSPHEIDEKNKLSDLALGLHYHLAGKKYKFTPYIAWNYFTTEEYSANTLCDKNCNNSGNVILTGVKVTF